MRHSKDRTPTRIETPARVYPRRATMGTLVNGFGALSGILGASIIVVNAFPALAQNDFAVDVTDPNVSVDMSVLNDGGLGPRVAAPVPATSSAAPTVGEFRAPGPKPPVSTLYIQPSESFTLPPQTKTLIAAPAPAPMPEPEMEPDTEIAEETPALPEVPEPAPAPEQAAELPVPPAPEVTAPVPVMEMPSEEAKAEPQPEPAPAPQAAPQEQAEPEPAPAPTPQPLQEVAKAEPIAPPPTVQAEPPAPQPAAPAPKAETPEPKTEAVAPPPPPQVLSAEGKPPMDETQTAPQPPAAPKTSPNAVVVDLPPKTEPTAEKPAVASLPPATGPLSDGDNMRIVFDHDSSKLPANARDALLSLADRLNQQDGLRLQLLAYAGDADTSASAARRLSLSRALAVRSFLIENGVRSTRIDVRALGNKSTEAVTERVDITIVER